jgi:DNA-binding LacI/PurR family transcriptional regulator
MSIPLYEQIYTHIIQLITTQQLHPGDRVLSEKELAEQFEVSRITSKKALEKLEVEGWIERFQGKGSFVAQSLPEKAEVRLPMIVTKTKNLLIGVVLPDFSDAYGLKLLQSIETHGAQLGHSIAFRRTNGQLETEIRAIRAFVDQGVDGLIVFPVHGEYYNPELLRLTLDKFPLVLVDRYLRGIPASSVYTDNRTAARQLTEYLIHRGHTHIGFISPPIENTSTIEDRYQGYQAALAAHDLSAGLQDRLVAYSTLPGAFSREKVREGAAVIQAFIAARPELSAFVVSEYNLACVLRQVLAHFGKADHYKIVCFDSPDNPLDPPLFSHIRQGEAVMGQRALDLLLRHIAGDTEPIHENVPFVFVEAIEESEHLMNMLT